MLLLLIPQFRTERRGGGGEARRSKGIQVSKTHSQGTSSLHLRLCVVVHCITCMYVDQNVYKPLFSTKIQATNFGYLWTG